MLANDILFVEKLVHCCAASDETEPTGNIRSEASPRVARRQRKQSAASEVGLCSEADSFDACAEVFAPEIFYVNTAAPSIVASEKLVLTDLSNVQTLVRIIACLLGWRIWKFPEASADIDCGRILVR